MKSYLSCGQPKGTGVRGLSFERPPFIVGVFCWQIDIFEKSLI